MCGWHVMEGDSPRSIGVVVGLHRGPYKFCFCTGETRPLDESAVHPSETNEPAES